MIRVLIVDDSAFSRDLLGAMLESDDDISIAGMAENGQEAVQKAAVLKPDIITMDIDMPVMGGLEAIGLIMSHSPAPILVVSGKADADTAFGALSNGALEVIPKSDVNIEDASNFIEKIKLLAKVKVITHIRSSALVMDTHTPALASKHDTPGGAVAIASSTGGPRALSILLAGLGNDFPVPIVIAQHIQNFFIAGMIDWLNRSTTLSVKVGERGEKIVPGSVYVSPSDRHMFITETGTINFEPLDSKDIYHPSCDKLLISVAKNYGIKALGVILTGMGDDGARGIAAIKDNGGNTIAQDEATSSVFGMPAVAIKCGKVDRVLPLEEIAADMKLLISMGVSH